MLALCHCESYFRSHSIVCIIFVVQEKELQTISLDQKKTQGSALPSLDIPKELWKLVDYLFSFGLAKVVCSEVGPILQWETVFNVIGPLLM